jgi:spermidine/putrescine-binding protein
LPPYLTIWAKIKQHKADDYTGPATDLLLKLRPTFATSSSQYINDLANGDICVAMVGQAMSGRRLTVRRRKMA